MARTKISELRQKTDSELMSLLTEEREKMREDHFNLAGGKKKSNKNTYSGKLTVARIMTIIKERSLE
jgi:ribosomal protein L29